jgi:hypothetical protein
MALHQHLTPAQGARVDSRALRPSQVLSGAMLNSFMNGFRDQQWPAMTEPARTRSADARFNVVLIA